MPFNVFLNYFPFLSIQMEEAEGPESIKIEPTQQLEI
jgi:hypothetical protein